MSSFFVKFRSLWHDHQLILVILGILSIVAAGTRALLPATVIQGNPEDDGTYQVIERAWPQSCSSSGTIFADIFDPDEVIDTYRSYASAAFTEREEHLQQPSKWRCEGTTFDEMSPPSPYFQTIAAQLPGLNEEAKFSNFSSVMLEFQRVFECKLIELQRQARDVVYRDGTDLKLYGSSPSAAQGFGEVDRITSFETRLQEEKLRSRLAMERSLNTIRSFEIAAPFSVEMECLQREVADLRIGMTLLADTVSCIPRVWDIATSLHSRDGE